MRVTASGPIDAPPTPTVASPVEVALGSRPLRIVTFASAFPNVATPRHGTLVSDRVRALAGVAEVEVMAPVPWSLMPGVPAHGGRGQWLPYIDRHRGLTVHHPRFPALPRVLRMTDPALLALSCAPSLMTLRRRFRFDLLDAYSAWPDGIAVAALAGLIGVPFSVTVRGGDFNIVAREPGRRALIRWALRRAALVITLSQEQRNRVVALGVPASRVSVIPNGVDIERFHPLDRGTARACLGIPQSARLLLSVGWLHRAKGFPALVNAVAPVVHEDPDVRLVIVGDPDPEADASPDIRAAISLSGLQGRVTLVSGRASEERAWWYNAADLLCLPTTRGGAVQVSLEAMACGLPCIMMNTGGDRTTISRDRFAVVAVSDSASMAPAIAEALRHPWDRDAVAREARLRRWEVVARECYEQFVGIGAPQDARRERSSPPR